MWHCILLDALQSSSRVVTCKYCSCYANGANMKIFYTSFHKFCAAQQKPWRRAKARNICPGELVQLLKNARRMSQNYIECGINSEPDRKLHNSDLSATTSATKCSHIGHLKTLKARWNFPIAQ